MVQSPVMPGPIDQGNANDAADRLSRLVAGNDHLITHPHLVSALVNVNATPQQAQAINMFVGGLQAKGRIEAATASGTKITLSSQEKIMLGAMGVDYSGVEYTAADRQHAVQAALVSQQQQQQPSEDSGGGGWGLGRIWHDVSHNPVTDVAGKGLNFVNQEAGHIAQSGKDSVTEAAHGDIGGALKSAAGGAVQIALPGVGYDLASKAGLTDDGGAHDEAMRAQGYDPSNPFSRWAYQFSGRDVLDINDLYKDHGHDQVNKALQYSADPQGYIDGLIQSGNTDGLKALQNPKFEQLIEQVNARRATPGNALTEFIDPVKHPNAQRYTATGIDVAYSFVADPTIIAFNAVKAARMSKLMLDGTDAAADGAKITNILDGTTKGLYATRVRRGVQSLLDNTATIREGIAAGDDAAVAAGYAGIRASTPDLVHLAPDFLGGVRATGFETSGAGGLRFETAEPITNMAEAADYLSSTVGLVRVRAGRPLVESSMMPGQLSRFGFRKLRGNLAAASAVRGVKRDSKLVIDLNKPGVAARILPKTDDSIDTATGRVFHDNGDGTVSVIDASGVSTGTLADHAETGTQVIHAGGVTPVSRLDDGSLVERSAGEAPVLTETAPTGLPSQVRGATHGEFGTALFESRKGVGPGAIAQRARLLGQRFASYLPRTTKFVTDDPNAAHRVFQYARMYLTPSRANLLAAAYAAGDEGVRKAILKGMELQTLHAAGLGTSEAGRIMIQEAEHSLDEARYASVGGGLDELIDPVSGEPMRAAVHGGQLRTSVTLTGFHDIQKVAAKVGLWENTIGRALNKPLTDNLMKVIKVGWILTGTNVVRNAGEDLFGAAVRGEYGDVIRAKAVAQSKNLLPKRTRLGNMLAAPLARVGELYRKGGINTADESLGLKYIASDWSEDEMAAFSDDWIHLHTGSMVDPQGVRNVDSITQAGYLPRKMRMSRTGYMAQTTEDLAGAERLENSLGIAINKTPEHTQAILDHLTVPSEYSIDDVVKSLQSPMNAKWVNQMTRSGLYKGEDGFWHKAVTPAEKDLALRQLAELQVADLKYLLSGKGGELNGDLVKFIQKHNKAPGHRWIMDHLTGENRPSTVFAPHYEPVPVEKGVTGFVGAVSDIAGKGYQHLVARPIARLSSMPVFLSNYGKARYELRGIEKALLKDGFSEEATNATLKRLASEMAFSRTVKYIDDPGLRTQMDLVGRNFFAFSRATTAFIRRWGTQFLEDPARLRKAMLTMEAGQKTGLSYTDENGEKQFIFPGTGMALEAMQKVESALSFGGRIPALNVYRVPGAVPGDLTGRVALLQPGLQNPLQFSLTPMINIPMRTVFDLFPDHRESLDKIDTFFNGKQGQGQSLLSEILPTGVKKFTDALNEDERDSLTASSVRSSILTLYSAYLDAKARGASQAELNRLMPGPDADAAQVDDWLQNLKVQAHNWNLGRALFGLFSPSPPGIPAADDAAGHADWFYGAVGVKNLDDEYKAILNSTDGDFGKANTIWTALHPDKMFYEVSSTDSTTKNATISATAASQAWMESHLDFLREYKGVSAYFVPMATQKGAFDIGAFNSQLELGLRTHKDLKEFYTDVRIRGAEELYFTALDSRNAAIAADPASESVIDKRFSAWYSKLKTLNPLFADKQNSFVDTVVTAENQLGVLRRLAKDKPSGIEGVGVVGQMIEAYDRYHELMKQYPGASNYAQAVHKSLSTQYNDWMLSIVQANPQLQGLYQGVFRTLDTHVLQTLGSSL